MESARRGRSAEETLGVWREMQGGSEEGARNCLRLKLDMSAANKALRDPVAFRCNPTLHHRTGTRYKARHGVGITMILATSHVRILLCLAETSVLTLNTEHCFQSEARDVSQPCTPGK